MVIPTKDKKARYSAMATVGDKHIFLAERPGGTFNRPAAVHPLNIPAGALTLRMPTVMIVQK